MATIFELEVPVFPSKLDDSDSDIEEHEVNISVVSPETSGHAGGKEDSNRCSDKMASLLPENGILYNHADEAPSPSKDYCQVVVSLKDVIFRIWRISLRNSCRVGPGEIKDSHEDFIYDDRMQSEICRVFGKPTYLYIRRICEGVIDYLPRLPCSCLIHIIRYLDLQDIAKLAQVSKQFKKLCVSDELWEKIYEDQSGTEVAEELRSLAEAIGWRKLFFMNKLQLQLQLHRFISSRPSTAASTQDSEGILFLTEEGKLHNDNDLRVASVTPSEIEQIEGSSKVANVLPIQPNQENMNNSAQQTPNQSSPESDVDIVLSEAYRYPIFSPREAKQAENVDNLE